MRASPVVNRILRKAYAMRDDDNLTPLRMQKMLYLVCGWYQCITNEVLVDEPFIKGEFGPVMLSVQDALRKYGAQPIGDYVSDWSLEHGTFEPLFVNEGALPQFMPILEKVWTSYQPCATGQLAVLCRQDNLAWERAPLGSPLDSALIRAQFLATVEATRARKLQESRQSSSA